jgi:hypothetical protein
MHDNTSDYRIHLNFLPVQGELPAFVIFRKLIASPQEARPSEQMMSYRLPQKDIAEEKWPSYWVSFEPFPDFEKFEVAPTVNRDLSKHVLFESLKRSAQKKLADDQIILPRNEFLAELSFVMSSVNEGQEVLVVQPYFLRAEKCLGFLIDFHFRLAKGVPFSRRVQQLSLSLDRNYRRNLDYCADRAAKIRTFLQQRRSIFDSLMAPATERRIAISKNFLSLPADTLASKRYIFANGKESRSQFMGLKEHGPLKPIDASPRLLFVFREQDRQAARLLATSLRGQTARGLSFPGFKALFKTDLEIDSHPVVLKDLTKESMAEALQRAKIDKQTVPNLLPVIVLPAADDNGYLDQKALFSHSEIPTQVCTLRILQDQDSLKWALGNLALQMFCKAGGMPWKVRPTSERSLIIGISQSHKIKIENEQPKVQRYFAFSVMTDNSGLFQKIQVLGEADDEQSYLESLKATLRSELQKSAKDFSRVVIHTSFKLKHKEIDAIRSVVNETAKDESEQQCKFAVIKVNHKSRFFGINEQVNSLVPFEGSMVSLGNHEYLVWFEGIFRDKPTVTKAFPGPTHLQFLRVNEQNNSWAEQRELIQDLVNLSGANWRGFNAKAAPVSVFYCHIVAEFVHDFYEHGLPLPAVKDIRPWFL